MTVTAGRSTVSSPRENITMTVGEFLLWRIREAGAGHAFGVPGDYNLELLQQFEDTGTLEWIGTCNEPNASYAADGYARLNGMAALIVTNPVGALRAPNDTLILTESLMDPLRRSRRDHQRRQRRSRPRLRASRPAISRQRTDPAGHIMR
jgi:hypothetical protein